MIAQTQKIVEDSMKNILIKEYWLPLKWKSWEYWKVKYSKDIWIPESEIIKEFEMYWEKITLKLWWKYDKDWNLDFTLWSYYPIN